MVNQAWARGILSTREDLDLHFLLIFLERTIKVLHIGGKTALEWYGIQHFVPQKPSLILYGWDDAQLPTWFTDRFPSSYHRKRLFNEPTEQPMYVDSFENREKVAKVSLPERAFLELLSEVGVSETMEGATEFAELSDRLRANPLENLLKYCRSVKTIRLCLHFGTVLELPWIHDLDRSVIHTGSDSAWVGKTADGLLVLKP